MKVDIYKSNINGNKFLSVQSGTDVTQIKTIDTDYAQVSPHKMGLDIKEGDGRIALDSGEAIHQIENHGFYLHQITVKFSVQE